MTCNKGGVGVVVKNAKFFISIGKLNQLKDFGKPEVAFIGRSNVGKSSLINYLCNIKSLAKTGATPGRTRLINYFNINDEIYFVDLPGYGFAKGDKKEQLEWKNLIEGYLQTSKNLKLVCLLIDIRRELNDDDKKMINYLSYYNIPCAIIVTKADKFAKSKMKQEAFRIAKEAKLGIENVYVCSVTAKIGRDEILDKIGQLVGGEGNE